VRQEAARCTFPYPLAAAAKRLSWKVRWHRLRVAEITAAGARLANLVEERWMRTLLTVSAALTAMVVSGVTEANELESGLKVGQYAGAFNVKDCTGASAGRSLCYR